MALLVKGNESPTVRAHAVEALNFQITWGVVDRRRLGASACAPSASCSSCRWSPGPSIIVFSVIAGMKANEGQLYRYPMTVRL